MKINSIFEFIGNNNSIYKNYKGIGEIDDNNLRQGEWGKYHSNGILLSKGNYVNGYRHGYWEEYWDNGYIHSKGNFKNGLKDGYWEYYYSDGKLSSKGTYVDGKYYEN